MFAGVSIEFLLMVSYAVFLALVAYCLERTARHAHRRSHGLQTAGFTYHAERDIWRCPEDQHLFPVFSDAARGLTVYRAPAKACNACRSKAACTDSDTGREVERRDLSGLQYGMQRFHRAFSLTLLVLSCLILAVEFLRAPGLYPRAILAAAFALFCGTAWRLGRSLRAEHNAAAASQKFPAHSDRPRQASKFPSW